MKDKQKLLLKYAGKPCAICNCPMIAMVVFGVSHNDNEVAICSSCAESNWVSNYHR